MSRLPAFAIVAVGLSISVTSSASAQTTPGALLRPVGLEAGGGPDWRTTLSPGARLPNHERLVVVGEDGQVLRIVDGGDMRVHLPPDLYTALVDGSLRATLVHNHLADQGFSCADFRQLAKVGVTGVVAIGGGGSVFEVAAGNRYDVRLFEEATCGRFFRQAADQLSARLGYAFGARSEPADQIPHLLASALARVGIIEYRTTPAIQATLAQRRFQLEFEQVVTRMATLVARGSLVGQPTR